ncbi:MAG: GTPase Era [Pseudomonadota bacterium]
MKEKIEVTENEKLTENKSAESELSTQNKVSSEKPTYCGFVALIGRPNVGKSTLLNALVKQKLSITSRKPNTTRNPVIGITTQANYQTIYVDTPGFQAPGAIKDLLNQQMNRAIAQQVDSVDVLVWLLDGSIWTTAEDQILRTIKKANCPVILCINKIDEIANKQQLLPLLQKRATLHDFAVLIPISALKHQQVEELQAEIQSRLPEGPHHYSADHHTDRGLNFYAAERIREKIIRQLGDELPYQTSVIVEKIEEKNSMFWIHALILVHQQSQKMIVIGQGGQRLKKIGEQARIELEEHLGCKVVLKLWVRVEPDWFDQPKIMHDLGFDFDS